MYSVQWNEHPTGIIRYHPDGGYGTSWTWLVVLEKLDESTCMLWGAMSAPPNRKELSDFIRSLGFTTAYWIRQNGKKVKVT